MKKARYLSSARRFLVLALLMLLAFPSHSLGEEATTEKIFSLVEQQLGYTKDQLSVNQIQETTEGGLAFSLKIKDADPTTNGLIIGMLDKAGNLVEIKGPQSIDLRRQYQRDWVASHFSYEDIYALVQKWRPIVNSMSPEELSEFDHKKQYNDLYGFLNHSVGLPTVEDLSHDEALACAKAEILKLPGWTQEKLDLFCVRTEVYHIPTGTERPAYFFIFGRVSLEFEEESDYKAWAVKEKTVFGDAVPYSVCVHIDAQTGELIGNIWVEFPPTYFNDTMLIILNPALESIGA